MSERILSNDEIAEMEKLTVDRLVETIDRGDSEGAKKLARRMYNEFLSMHDLYRNWTAATLSFVGKRFGDKALEEAMEEGVKAWWGPNLDKMPQGLRARGQDVRGRPASSSAAASYRRGRREGRDPDAPVREWRPPRARG